MSREAIRIVVGRPLIVALIIFTVACNKSEQPAIGAIRSFASPDEAGNALLDAVKSGDKNALLAIFGTDSKDLIFSGDAVQDKNTGDAFIAAYGVMHRWRKLADGAESLLVGADNFSFPIPLRKNAGGRWSFDAAAGKDEILARRVGRNELAVIDICGGLGRRLKLNTSDRLTMAEAPNNTPQSSSAILGKTERSLLAVSGRATEESAGANGGVHAAQAPRATP